MSPKIKLITVAILSCIYNNAMASVDGSFTIPEFSQSEIIGGDWLTNSTIGQSIVDDTTILPNNRTYIPVDSAGNYITSNNVVYIKNDAPVLGSVYGGKCISVKGCNIDNVAVIVSGSQTSLVMGGNVESGSASVYLNNDAHILQRVYGIYAQGGDWVSDTSSLKGSIYITDDVTVTRGVEYTISIIGAYRDTDNEVDNYTVSTDGMVYIGGNAYIGESIMPGYYSNFVIGATSLASGANSITNTATGNVYINDNTFINAEIMGVNASTTSWFRYGQIDNEIETIADVTGNVYISGNSTVIAREIIGANSTTYKYTPYNIANIPSLMKNTVKGNVYLQGDATIIGSVYGVKAQSGFNDDYVDPADSPLSPSDALPLDQIAYVNATGNVSIFGNVTFKNQTDTSDLYTTGIYGSIYEVTPLNKHPIHYNVFNGNTLSFGNKNVVVNGIGNFETYNFYLNDYNKHLVVNNTTGQDGVGLITVNDTIQNNNTVDYDADGNIITTSNKSEAHVAGISGDDIVIQGQSIVLIDASNANSFIMGEDPSETVSNISEMFTTKTGDVDEGVKVGLVKKADVRYIVDETDNKIIAVIDDVYTDQETVDSNVKPLATGRLATLENVTRGADLLFDVTGQHEEVGTYTPFVSLNSSINTYRSVGHYDTKDYRFILGSRYQWLSNFYTGVALEYGYSDYKKYDEVFGSPRRGNGDTYNYGVSIFSKYTIYGDNFDTYLDTALRFGKTSTKYNADDIITGGGKAVSYKTSANYVAANIGVGIVSPLSETSKFDTSIRYLWTRLQSDNVLIEGDKINFDTATSSRLQLKEKFSYQSSETVNVSIAGIYEYEFDSKAGANIYNYSIDAPNAKGSTGIIEFGVEVNPWGYNDLSLNVNARGYGGKRNGVSASAFIQYDF